MFVKKSKNPPSPKGLLLFYEGPFVVSDKLHACKKENSSKTKEIVTGKKERGHETLKRAKGFFVILFWFAFFVCIRCSAETTTKRIF